MERPQTRRGSSQTGNYWDNPESGGPPSSAGQSDISPRPPTGRMPGDYSAQKSLGSFASRISTSMRPPTSGFNSTDANGPSTLTQRMSAVNRPGTRAGTAVTPAGGFASMRLVSGIGHNNPERPTTQQGLAGMRTASRGLPQRQIQDKTYYLGLLRSKMTELNAEIGRLTKSVEKNNKELQSLQSLENKVKEMALEIFELQGQAADLNLLQEKIATSSDPSQMEAELHLLANENERESLQVEHIFEDVKNSKEKVAALEKAIQIENDNADKFITTLSSEEQQKYMTLKNEKERLVKEVDNKASQLTSLESRALKMEAELKSFPAKNEMYRSRQILAELEIKHEFMLEQESKRLSPEEERAQLLASVKNDNAEVNAMEQQIKEISGRIEQINNELKEVDDSFEDSQTERGQKYRDLRKREQVMDEFLSTWEENCQDENERLGHLESQITITLQKISKQQSLMQLVPSITEYSSTKEDLSIKEGELEKSKATLEGIAVEYQRLQNNLQKMEDLEGKINEEMNTLKDQLATIQISAVKFTNLDDLRHETEDKRNQLILEQEDLAERKNLLQDRSRRLQAEFDKLQFELDKNETHKTLFALEEKLRILDEDNTSIESFLSETKSKLDVPKRREQVMEIVHTYMKSLQVNN